MKTKLKIAKAILKDKESLKYAISGAFILQNWPLYFYLEDKLAKLK